MRYWIMVLIVAVVALGPALALAEWIDLGGGEPVAVRMISDDGSRSVMEITVGGFEAVPVEIDGATYYLVDLPGEGRQMVPGLPQLPAVRRSLIIPDDAEMGVTILESEHVDLADMPVAPSKGHLLRTVDPASVPYTFDAFYNSQGTYPQALVGQEDPFILRDLRGLVVDGNLFQYDAGRRSLRVTTRLVVEVAPIGPGRINVLARREPLTKVDPEFADLYRNHFVNAATGERYPSVPENGGLLIIAYDAYASYMQPLVDWKNQKGIPTRLVTLSETGSSYTQIFDYIQADYVANHIAYVLLVGDGQHVPKYGTDSDPVYALVAGGDSYPDLFVGRFSAETPQHVQTQVARTIAYERDIVAGAAWPQSATGIASAEGPGHYGEYDYQHMDNIRTDLLAYGYTTVDQIYDTNGGTAAMVTNALNTGRGFMNYCGHGSATSWVTTGFTNTNVNALANVGLPPFICSVACNNGTFTGQTCFAEAWLRATSGGQPTGAIATYMSYISQSWDPPMYAEDEVTDLLRADQKHTVGGLFFNGSCKMIEVVGAQGVTEFRNWMIFGDPSVLARTKAAAVIAASHAGVLLIGMNQYPVDVPGVAGALCALYGNGVLYGSATTDVSGHAVIALAAPPAEPMTLTLTVTAFNKATVVEPVQVLPPDGPYLIFSSTTVGGNGVLDYAETADLTVSLQNVGVADATGLTGVLTTDDPFVTIADGALAFPDIAPGDAAASVAPCAVEIAANVPDGHLAQFSLAVTGDSGVWTVAFLLTINAPVLAVQGVTVDDPQGNHNGYADPGETVSVQVVIANNGHAACANLTGVLTSLDAYGIVVNATGLGAGIAAGGTGVLSGMQVEISPSCPVPASLGFEVAISDEFGIAADGAFQMTVGGWYDDFETDRGWTAGLPGDTAVSGVWTRVDPVGTVYNGNNVQPEDDHTPAPGTLCFVTGNGVVGGLAGESDVDGGTTTLLSPVFDLTGAISATVSYWRVYTNNLGNNPGLDWWTVQATSDGVTWVNLERTQASQTAWTQFTFELTDYVTMTDRVQLRFVADDQAPGSLVEAAVDDVLLSVERDLSTPVADPALAPARLALGEAYPNPFNPKTTIQFDLPTAGRAELAIFDLAGRKVATLVSDQLAAGRHTATWLGQDDTGRRVASGVYFYRLQTDGQQLARKLMLVK